MHQTRFRNENFLKCVFCSRYFYKDCCVTEQTLPKNTASDKSEAVCMPCSIKFNINNLADISVHDLIESNTSREPDNMVSNPTCEDFLPIVLTTIKSSLPICQFLQKDFSLCTLTLKLAQKFR